MLDQEEMDELRGWKPRPSTKNRTYLLEVRWLRPEHKRACGWRPYQRYPTREARAEAMRVLTRKRPFLEFREAVDN